MNSHRRLLRGLAVALMAVAGAVLITGEAVSPRQSIHPPPNTISPS